MNGNDRPSDAPPPAVAPFDAARAHALQEAWAKHLGVPVEFMVAPNTGTNGRRHSTTSAAQAAKNAVCRSRMKGK